MSEEETRLHSELEEVRKRYTKALAEYRSAYSVFLDLGAEHSDGNLALKNANTVLSTATADFQNALRRFSEIVLHRPKSRLQQQVERQ